MKNFFKLPQSVLNIIFSYDSTYRDKYLEVINNINMPSSSIKIDLIINKSIKQLNRHLNKNNIKKEFIKNKYITYPKLLDKFIINNLFKCHFFKDSDIYFKLKNKNTKRYKLKLFSIQTRLSYLSNLLSLCNCCRKHSIQSKKWIFSENITYNSIYNKRYFIKEHIPSYLDNIIYSEDYFCVSSDKCKCNCIKNCKYLACTFDLL